MQNRHGWRWFYEVACLPCKYVVQECARMRILERCGSKIFFAKKRYGSYLVLRRVRAVFYAAAAGTTERTKNTHRLLKSVLPCTLFNDKFFWQKTCYCIEPRPSLGVLKYHLPLAFENSGTGYKARTKIKRRHGKKYTSLYIFYLRVCRANTLLRGTTAIRGGS